MIGKGQGIIHNILNILDTICFGSSYFQIAMLLRRSMLLNGCLYNCAVGHNLSKKEIRELNQIDKCFFSCLLHLPFSAPEESVHLELGENDIDYKVFNKEGDLIAYAEVKGRLRPMNKAFPLPVAIRKLVKLSDKRLNPIMIWACEDGLIYSTVDKLKGEIRWGGRPPRDGAVNDSELMAYFQPNVNFKYIKYI